MGERPFKIDTGSRRCILAQGARCIQQLGKLLRASAHFQELSYRYHYLERGESLVSAHRCLSWIKVYTSRHEACRYRSIRRLVFLLLNELLFVGSIRKKGAVLICPGGGTEAWPHLPRSTYSVRRFSAGASLLRISGVVPCGLAMDCHAPIWPRRPYFGIQDACSGVA